MAYFRKRDWKTILLVSWLILTPLLINATFSLVTGLSKDVEITYNANDVFRNVQVNGYNGSWYSTLQSTVVLSDNMTVSIPSIVLPTVSNPSKYTISFVYNITNLLKDVYKIEIIYTYVGSGNITKISIYAGGSITQATMINEYLITLWNNPTEQNTTKLVYTLETFQSIKLQNNKGLKVFFVFEDSMYFLQNGDYLEISLKFYKKSTILTKDQIITGIVLFFSILNILIAISITKFWNPLSRRS